MPCDGEFVQGSSFALRTGDDLWENRFVLAEVEESNLSEFHFRFLFAFTIYRFQSSTDFHRRPLLAFQQICHQTIYGSVELMFDSYAISKSPQVDLSPDITRVSTPL